MSDYPEHKKLEAIQEQSQAIGEFLEWISDNGDWRLGKPHHHIETCKNPDYSYHNFRYELGDPSTWEMYLCGYASSQFESNHRNVDKLLAEFYQIDLNALEKEKRAMLDEIRKVKA